MNSLDCVYAERCSGCDWIRTPYENQREQKVADFMQHLQDSFGLSQTAKDQSTSAVTTPKLNVKSTHAIPNIRWIATRNGGMRTRTDLTLDSKDGITKLGLYSREHRELVDLDSCSQLTPELNDWLKEFKKMNLGVERGSVRLRTHGSLRGVWLDFANVDIKRLLDERKALDELRALAIVEIGQKRKRLVERDGQLKLADPILENWFDTYTSDGTPIPLYSTIGTFTQPGPIANRELVKEVLRMLQAASINRIAEFGSGIGNFTLPLASLANEVRVFEIDTLALEGLKQSLEIAGLSSRVQIHAGNFQVSRKTPPPLEGLDAILVDPPRSGIGQFLNSIAAMDESARPTHFVYVSCFAESFAQDAKRLFELGYHMADVAIVDQFPQSRHYEIVSRFERR